MGMKVSTLASKNAVYVDTNATVIEAAKQMRNHHVGALVVTSAESDEFHPVGIVTDRDIVVAVLALDLDPKILTVGDIMGETLFKARPDEDALATIQRMRRLGVRRAPVVSDDGELRGMFTLDDFIAHLAHAMSEVSLLILHEQSEEQSHRVTPG
jgi:CBS domain-containing protein